MSALQLYVTTAGKAAMVNFDNTGLNPIVISHVGVTASIFTASNATTALPGEIKRLTTFAGAAVADDTIHLTIRDDTADVYTLRGIALYMDGGSTLFGVYSQAGAIMEKSAAAMLLMSLDCRFVDLDVDTITFGDASFLNPPATTVVPGVVELATDVEAIAGTDNTRAMTPLAHKAAVDSRFGIGAPSGFFKPLLALATAALIRAALEIKGAALKDEGHTNGLDADKLDGQHGAFYLNYDNLTNKPAGTGAHTHDASDITSGLMLDARIAQSNVKQYESVLAIAWTQITGKPATYPPSAHNHDAGDITSGTFASARVAQANVTQHQAALSIAWTQITGKPATYPPSAHTHIISEVTGLQAALDAKAALAGATFTGAVNGPSFNATSAKRYKTDIVSIDPKRAAALIEGLRMVWYRLVVDGSRSAGIIAEELTGGPFDFAVIRNDKGDAEAVNYQALFAVAIAAHQHLADRVDALELKAKA